MSTSSGGRTPCSCPIDYRLSGWVVQQVPASLFGSSLGLIRVIDERFYLQLQHVMLVVCIISMFAI